jgi:sugar lactone lactonase YvrE
VSCARSIGPCRSPIRSVFHRTGASAISPTRRAACSTASIAIPEPAVFVDWRGRDGFIDGSVVDADGVLWNARWAGGAVDAWAPDGRRLHTIAVPAAQATCPAFAGPDASRLVVTSAWKGRSERQRDAEPDAGKTFLIDRPVRGRFEPRVKIA